MLFKETKACCISIHFFFVYFEGGTHEMICMTYSIGPCECHSCFSPLAQKILFSHTCKMLISMFFVVEGDNRHDTGTCSGTVCRTACSYILVYLEKRWLFLLCPAHYPVARKKRIAGTGQILSPLYSVCASVWLCIPLF